MKPDQVNLLKELLPAMSKEAQVDLVLKMMRNSSVPQIAKEPPDSPDQLTEASVNNSPSGVPQELQTLLHSQSQAISDAVKVESSADAIPELPPIPETASQNSIPEGISPAMKPLLRSQEQAIAEAAKMEARADAAPEIPMTRAQRNDLAMRQHPDFAQLSGAAPRASGMMATSEQQERMRNSLPPIVLKATDGKPGFSSGIPEVPQHEGQQASVATNRDDAEIDSDAMMGSFPRDFEKDFEPSTEDKLHRLKGEIIDQVQLMFDEREGA